MKKIIKWGAIVGGVLLVLIIAALLIIPRFVDVQKYKPVIEKKVADATGRPFSLGGDLSLSLFPWAGLAFSDLHLGNPPGFKEKDLLTVKSFEMRVKLLPLLSKEIQVKRFILEEPRIVLERLKDGRSNWEGIGKPSGEAAPTPQKEKEKPSEGKPGTGFPIKSLVVGEFAITDGFLLWIDHVKGARKQISNATLRLMDVSLDRPVQISLAAQLDGRPLAIEGSVGPLGKDPGKGTILLDLGFKALEQLDMSVKGKIVDPGTRKQFDLALKTSPFSVRKLLAAVGQDLPVVTADPEALNRVALNVKLKGDAESVSISDGTLNLDESTLVFSLTAKDFSRPDVSFDFNLDQIDLARYLPPPSEKKPDEAKQKDRTPAEKKTDYKPLRRLVLDGKIRIGTLMARGAKIQDFYMKVSGKNGRFIMDPLSLKLQEGDASVIQGMLDVGQDVPKFNFEVQVSPFSPRKLLAAAGQDFPVVTADPEALNRVALNVKLRGDAENVSISDGTLNLDESKLIFSAKARNFSKPEVTFDLDLDRIDLDRYLPPASQKKPDKEKKKAETLPGEKIDYTLLRRLTLDGKMRAGKIKAHGAKFQDLYLKVFGQNGRFYLDPLTLNLYKGNVTSKGALDVRQDTPESNLELRGQGIQVGPLLKDLLDKDFLEGTVKSDVAVHMTGDDADKIKRTLNGKGDLIFNDGAIVGIDLAGMVRNVKATFGLAEKSAERPRTDFSELHAPFTITNGVVNTPGTNLQSPLIRVVATGKANLVKESLDFRVEPKFVATLKGQGDATQRSGIMVPVLVTGTFSSPKFRPDLKGMLKQQLEGGKDLFKGGTEQEEPLQPLKDKVKGLFKSLPFGQ